MVVTSPLYYVYEVTTKGRFDMDYEEHLIIASSFAEMEKLVPLKHDCSIHKVEVLGTVTAHSIPTPSTDYGTTTTTTDVVGELWRMQAI